MKDGNRVVAEFRKALWQLHTLGTVEYKIDLQPGVLLAWLKIREN